MKSWQTLATCRCCGFEKIKRKDEIPEQGYLCVTCARKQNGKRLGNTYGKAQVPTPYYCIDCAVFLKNSIRVKRCAPCHSKFMSARFSGENNPAWTGKSKCECGGSKSTSAKRCRACSFKSGERSGENNGRFKKEDREYWLQCKKAKKIIATSLINSLKKNKQIKNEKTTTILGYSVQQFKTHIEKLFLENMSWDNWDLTGWHLDHKVPVSWFIENKCFDIKIVNSLNNLQPLWAKDNISKRDKCQLSIEEVEKLLGVKLNSTENTKKMIGLNNE